MKTHRGVRVSENFGTGRDDDENLAATLAALNGRDATAVFGADVEHDRIKFTDWSPDTCGCTVRFMWHRDHPQDGRVHHGHATITRCTVHQSREDPATHYAALVAENQHKNTARQALADELHVDVGEVTHSYTPAFGGRLLNLHHPKLSAPRVVQRKG